MGYITTYTGKHFDPIEPNMEALDVRDIAHALSLTCRGNGHVKSFFSVGQHCVNCAKEAVERGYSRRVVLGCLLHDASEAYMSDVPRPFKDVLTEYQKLENKLIDMIYFRFLGSSLTEEEKLLVKEVDDDLLYFDMIELLGVPQTGIEPKINIKLDYSVQPFEKVEEEFMNLYEEWQIN